MLPSLASGYLPYRVVADMKGGGYVCPLETFDIAESDGANVVLCQLALPVGFTPAASPGARCMSDVFCVGDPSKVLDAVVLGVEVDVVAFVAFGGKANERFEDEMVNHPPNDLAVSTNARHEVPALDVLEGPYDPPAEREPALIVASGLYAARKGLHPSMIRDFVPALESDNRKPSFWGILFGSHLASFVGQLVRAAGRATVSRSSFYFREILPC